MDCISAVTTKRLDCRSAGAAKTVCISAGAAKTDYISAGAAKTDYISAVTDKRLLLERRSS